MAWFRSPVRGDIRRLAERGATLSEYAILASLVVVVSIGAIGLLEDESGSYLNETGSDIGTPRELAAEMDPDLPDAPDWLSVPPPPTTTTTAAPTTTTVAPTTAAPTTAAPTTGAPTTGAPTTAAPTTAAPTTAAPTTAVSFPTGTVQVQGYMHSRRDPDRCFDAQSPGVVGSTIKASSCVGAWEQQIKTTGTASVVALQFTNPVNSTLCFSNSSGTLVLASCDGGAWQLFNVTVSSGRYIFQSQSDTSRCLESRSDGLELRTCDSGRRQQMLF